MATITSTIKLVDQMTPTLNKISKAIDRVQSQTNKLNGGSAFGGLANGATRATKSSHNLYNALRRVAYTLMMLRGLKGAVDVTDTMMNATARINNINDGLYDTAEYLDIIYGAAQRSRGSFSNMAASVGKLGTVAGDAFNNVNEMIAFTELMNKLFVLSGSSAAEASNAMYQLTQAMAAGRLQGDEMRSILENAPLLAKKIADHLGVTKGELKKLGAEGVITADIIKSALFGAAKEIETRFAKMPKTIGQIWTEIKNYCLNAFRPVIERIQKFINSPIFEKFKNKIFNIITAIANAIIRLFDAFESSRVQEGIGKITRALGALWEIASAVGMLMVNVARWICDNWSWIAPIVYGIVYAFLIYKGVMLIVSVATAIFEAALWLLTNPLGQIVLYIALIIGVLYLAVAAWNYFTGQTISATGFIFGAIAALVSLVIDIFILAGDLFMTLIHIIVALGKAIVQVCVDSFQFIIALVTNITILAVMLVVSALYIVVSLGSNIISTLQWVIDAFGVWGSNIIAGMSQLCAQLPLYWESFKASVAVQFWEIVAAAGNAFNALLQGAGNLCTKMVMPFVHFVNKVISLLNSIIDGWNSLASSLTLTVPNDGIAAKLGLGGKSISLIGNGISRIQYVSAAGTRNWGGGGVDMGGVNSNLSNAKANLASIASQIKEINWNTNEIPKYNVDWGNTFSGLGDIWSGIPWADVGGAFKSEDYTGIIDGMVEKIGNTLNSSNYINIVDAYKNWYDKGAALENGVTGIFDVIGGLLDGLFGKGSGSSNGLGTDDLRNEMFDIKNPSGTLPNTLEDLLNGFDTGTGSGIGDALGAIGNNTGSSAGSLSNIEDTMDLAEEELELLRKLAEQEVINRFTTAEIHVDMTNNNNVSSNIDLDGIVTHLSNKLYQELGVVASGVHY